MTSKFPELGFYTLAGHTKTPADLLTEVADAEALGLGSAWISERFDVKERASQNVSRFSRSTAGNSSPGGMNLSRLSSGFWPALSGGGFCSSLLGGL